MMFEIYFFYILDLEEIAADHSAQRYYLLSFIKQVKNQESEYVEKPGNIVLTPTSLLLTCMRLHVSAVLGADGMFHNT